MCGPKGLLQAGISNTPLRSTLYGLSRGTITPATVGCVACSEFWFDAACRHGPRVPVKLTSRGRSNEQVQERKEGNHEIKIKFRNRDPDSWDRVRDAGLGPKFFLQHRQPGR